MKIDSNVRVSAIAKYLVEHGGRKFITKNNDLELCRNKLFTMRYKHMEFDTKDSENFLELNFDEIVKKTDKNDLITTELYQFMCEDFRKYDSNEAVFHKLGKMVIQHCGINYKGVDTFGFPIGVESKPILETVCIPKKFMYECMGEYTTKQWKIEKMQEELERMLKEKFIKPIIIQIEYQKT